MLSQNVLVWLTGSEFDGPVMHFLEPFEQVVQSGVFGVRLPAYVRVLRISFRSPSAFSFGSDLMQIFSGRQYLLKSRPRFRNAHGETIRQRVK